MGSEPLLLLYDEECPLCRGLVAWVQQQDRSGCIRAEPLQGPVGRRVLTSAGLPGDPDTMVVVQGGRPALRSAAALAVGQALGGVWAAGAWVGRWLPRPLMDAAYRAVARRRRALFPPPDPADRAVV